MPCAGHSRLDPLKISLYLNDWPVVKGIVTVFIWVNQLGISGPIRSCIGSSENQPLLEQMARCKLNCDRFELSISTGYIGSPGAQQLI